MTEFFVYLNDAITYISDILVFLIVFAGLVLLNNENKLAVCIFSLAVLMFDIVDNLIPKSLYYIGAAVTDLIIIVALTRFAHPTELIVKLQNISIRFIYINLFGWFSFMLYFSPNAYNLLCAALYAWTLITIFRGRDKNVLGNNAVGRRRLGFRSHDYPSGDTMQTNQKATTN